MILSDPPNRFVSIAVDVAEVGLQLVLLLLRKYVPLSEYYSVWPKDICCITFSADFLFAPET